MAQLVQCGERLTAGAGRLRHLDEGSHAGHCDVGARDAAPVPVAALGLRDQLDVYVAPVRQDVVRVELELLELVTEQLVGGIDHRVCLISHSGAGWHHTSGTAGHGSS